MMNGLKVFVDCGERDDAGCDGFGRIGGLIGLEVREVTLVCVFERRGAVVAEGPVENLGTVAFGRESVLDGQNVWGCVQVAAEVSVAD